jgi:hypothetical protein
MLLLGLGGTIVYSGTPLLNELWFTRNGFSMLSYESVADWNLSIISGCCPAPDKADTGIVPVAVL